MPGPVSQKQRESTRGLRFEADYGMRSLLMAVTTLAVAATTLSARQSPPPDMSKIGVQVGQSVPDFVLPDQNGTRQTLKSVLGPNGAMLVFFRSADW